MTPSSILLSAPLYFLLSVPHSILLLVPPSILLSAPLSIRLVAPLTILFRPHLPLGDSWAQASVQLFHWVLSGPKLLIFVNTQRQPQFFKILNPVSQRNLRKSCNCGG